MDAFQQQIGGDHYKKMKIQPFTFSMENGLDPIQHTIIKYVTRYESKKGLEDLNKAKHCVDLLIAYKYPDTIKVTPETIQADQIKVGNEKVPDSGQSLIRYLLDHQFSTLIFKSLVHEMLKVDWEGTQEAINAAVKHHPLVEKADLLDILMKDI